MWSALQRIAEEKIREAQRQGAFDQLPGAGQPLPDDHDPLVPEDLRLAYKMLKNAGCLPPELEEQREIHTAQELLAGITDEAQRYQQIRKLNYLVMKANEARRGRVDLERHQSYYPRVVERLGQGGHPEKTPDNDL